jgi:hypothetical protein
VHLCEKLGEEVLERPVEPHREEGVDEVVGPGKALERGLQLDGIEDLERFDAVEAQDGLEGVEVAAKGIVESGSGPGVAGGAAGALVEVERNLLPSQPATVRPPTGGTAARCA